MRNSTLLTSLRFRLDSEEGAHDAIRQIRAALEQRGAGHFPPRVKSLLPFDTAHWLRQLCFKRRR